MDKIFTVAVVGPTASGKTELAVRLAELLGGEIVSADSMQIYSGMDNAVAMPESLQRQRAVHHMIDFLPLTERFSVAQYTQMAMDCIKDIAQRGKLPIVCGGTGFYINSLLDGISFTEDGFDNDVRKRLSLEYDELGGMQMLDRLMQLDSTSASMLHPNDKKRIVRALELCEITGRTKTQQNILSKVAPSMIEACYIGLTSSDRQYLYNRINKRVDIMLDNGLVSQAEEFFKHGDYETGAQAIGYKELKEYFDGNCTLDEAVEKLKMQTRRYAKRQLTWFRRNEKIDWFEIDKIEFDEIVEIVCKKIEKHRREM